ncbi:MAG: hypothetical protein WCL50_11685 [Spirochaetota bacterium]
MTGELPVEAPAAIKAVGFDARRFFVGTSGTRLADAAKKLPKRVEAAVRIGATCSAHDLRPLYAVTEDHRDWDIHRMLKLLGHASIQMIERCLGGAVSDRLIAFY